MALQGVAPPERESDHAARGTAAHEIADLCLRGGGDALDYLGIKRQAKAQEVEIDEELATSAQAYVDYVRGRLALYRGKTRTEASLWIEQRFSLEALSPPFEAGGTGDAVLHFSTWETLEVVDLKNGMGVVDVKGNPQLRTYGLGGLLKFPHLRVRKVRVTIVQPRVDHPDGRIRSEEFHVADLIDWTVDLLAAMHRSAAALAAFPGIAAGAAFDAWAERWLKPEACKFCRAEGFCPALRNRAQEVAAIWFDADARPAVGMAPPALSPEELARVLDSADLIDGWLNAVRGYAHTLAEGGTLIPDYQLVDKRPRRSWNGEDDAEIAKGLGLLTKRPPADFFDLKLRSPAQVEKLIGAKNKGLIASMWSSKSSGTNLVRSDKTARPALAGLATRHFEPPPET